MASFQIKFHRYASKGGDSRISNVVHYNSNDGFDAAYDYASTMMRGMVEAAPEYKYSIISIISHDYRGTDCSENAGGVYIFETAEEFTARCAEKKSA